MGMTKAMLGGKLMFPSDYIAAVECRGKDVTLTIQGVQIEQMQMQKGKKEPKPILTFKETKKKLALNKTNASSIAEMYGAEAEKWSGKRITIYPTRTQFGRDTVDCIRVREIRPAGQAGPPPKSITADPEPHNEDYETSPFAAGNEGEPPIDSSDPHFQSPDDSPEANPAPQRDSKPAEGSQLPPDDEDTSQVVPDPEMTFTELTEYVVSATGMDRAAVEKQIPKTMVKPWNDLNEGTRQSWLNRFAGGNVPGLKKK